LMTLRTIHGELYAGRYKVLRGWESFNGWYWFAVKKIEERRVAEGSVVDDTIWFGLVQGSEEEWGEFSEAEIKALGNRAWPIKPQDLPAAGRRNRR